MQTVPKQHVYLCCAEIKSDEWNQWSLLYSSSLTAFSGWLNDSSSRHPWTEWDVEAELCGTVWRREAGAQIHPHKQGSELRWNQSSIPFTIDIKGWDRTDWECTTGEHFIFLKIKLLLLNFCFTIKKNRCEKCMCASYVIVLCVTFLSIYALFSEGESVFSGWSLCLPREKINET